MADEGKRAWVGLGRVVMSMVMGCDGCSIEVY